VQAYVQQSKRTNNHLGKKTKSKSICVGMGPFVSRQNSNTRWGRKSTGSIMGKSLENKKRLGGLNQRGSGTVLVRK